MSFWTETLNQAATGWWPYIMDTTWQASLLALVLLLLVRLRPRWPSNLRYAILIIALLKFRVCRFGGRQPGP